MFRYKNGNPPTGKSTLFAPIILPKIRSEVILFPRVFSVESGMQAFGKSENKSILVWFVLKTNRPLIYN
jgi:hypothetical protein